MAYSFPHGCICRIYVTTPATLVIPRNNGPILALFCSPIKRMPLAGLGSWCTRYQVKRLS